MPLQTELAELIDFADGFLYVVFAEGTLPESGARAHRGSRPGFRHGQHGNRMPGFARAFGNGLVEL
jgi:hypothetical protein